MPTTNLGRIGFVNKGTYNPATAYKKNDIVNAGNNNVYAAILPSTGQLLTNTAYWEKWIDSSLLAPLSSPAFTNIPTAPTAAAGTNTTQLATTAFVLANSSPWELIYDGASLNPNPTPVYNGEAAYMVQYGTSSTQSQFGYITHTGILNCNRSFQTSNGQNIFGSASTPSTTHQTMPLMNGAVGSGFKISTYNSDTGAYIGDATYYIYKIYMCKL